MKEIVRRALGKSVSRVGLEKCVYCGQGHFGNESAKNRRDIWQCRRCYQLNASVVVNGTHFTRAATRLERAEEKITNLTRYHRIIDPRGMNFPSPTEINDVLSPKLPPQTRDMHYAMIRSEWEEVVKRIKALTERHKDRRLAIIASWDIESMNWGATISFNPKDPSTTFGRGYVQAYGASSAEELISGLEKQFNEERFLDRPDDQMPFFVSSDVVKHLIDKVVREAQRGKS